jgi:serine phosphatase RsbU (regulator of sigma subunit)
MRNTATRPSKPCSPTWLNEAPETIIQRLTAGGEEWAAGRPQDDDITLVVLKVKG